MGTVDSGESRQQGSPVDQFESPETRRCIRSALLTFFAQPPPSHRPYRARRLCRIVENMGKVHGSLARAGKVKGQTPKVEAQEKKKQPRGRAKKRMQYNRRYVNVVTGMGGKKVGPNSNADKMK
ncbi:hypothetical protein THAOC_35843 [Thalassiosira oceanica]|uniref:Uncharacterized protein n=3 Tax=Thalassiosirophycidae TaxID=33846 RepID=K0R2S3_THAOC|nr:hypothetical protein THAOC_35843 [Thalassiosira oceanica]|eukprot:EJK45539.1 hypothetical protein THAOC_35843 [Thalassiosira oceanica]